MLKHENLAANFYGLLARHYNYQQSAIEWRILGQEQDGSMLSSWISTAHSTQAPERSHIGLYNPLDKSFNILHSFEQRVNCIQATVNRSMTLLSFVLKTARNKTSDSETITEWIYTPYIVEVQATPDAADQSTRRSLLASGSQQQILTQFLWQKDANVETIKEDRLLLFVHNETITILKTEVRKSTDGTGDDEQCEQPWRLDMEKLTREVIVKHFVWAQWDPVVQALYYIHLKPAARSLLEKDDSKTGESGATFTTTLSAHQFNANSPRETVVGGTFHFCRRFIAELSRVFPLFLEKTELLLVFLAKSKVSPCFSKEKAALLFISLVNSLPMSPIPAQHPAKPTKHSAIIDDPHLR